MDKRGVDLTLNTVILGILVVLVLLVVVTFFVGGTTQMVNEVRGIFFGTTAGTSETLAVQTCNNRCDQALLLATFDSRKGSAFCTQQFEIDKNNDGEADYTMNDKKKIRKEFYCPEDWPKTPKVAGAAFELLGVPCEFSCETGKTPQQKAEELETKKPEVINPTTPTPAASP